MGSKIIDVLVVDDSPLLRELIAESLCKHSDMRVVGAAADGRQALECLSTLQPDVVTLDMHMPVMDGLATLDRILETRPVPVIAVSSLTQRAAETTMQALQRGALDYIAKPEGIASMQRVFGHELPAKIRNMAGADVRRILHYRKTREQRSISRGGTAAQGHNSRFYGCIAIGVSTGGPPALSHLFGGLFPPLPPVVVVQHMPPLFTGPFAARLNSLAGISVKEAENGDILSSNNAYVAPGGKHLSLARQGGEVVVHLSEGEFVSGHRPSVDVMMESAAAIYGKACVGVIMTGMGRDGATGCRHIRSAGGYVLGQDELTSDVYGMNKVAFSEGNVDRQWPLDRLAEEISATARARCPSLKLTPAKQV